MMPRFAAPEWLILLPVLVFGAWYWRRPELFRPLRFASALLLVLVLAEPYVPRGGRGIDLWVLLDRSASARELLEPRLAEMTGLLDRARPTGGRLFLVDYADVPQLRSESPGEIFSGNAQATATATAVQFALSHASAGRPMRILLVTDGYGTEPLTGVAERLVSQGVALDTRILTRAVDRDYRAESLEMPGRVQVGEPFLLQARIAGTPDGAIPLDLLQDGRVVGHAVADVRDGSAQVTFADRLPQGGAHRYTVRLAPAKDALAGNNEASAWVEVMGGPRVLLVTAYTDDPAAAALRAQGFDVETVDDPARLGPGDLAGARAVLLDNVPAYRLPPPFLASLDLFVRVQGGGLAMAGGKNSFGAGGYFGSAIDPLLPVSMELREEHRKLAVAMAIVMDRSGSMAAAVDGAGATTKMDLANEGAARSIDLLGGNDAIAVIAVDSEAHTVVPMTQAGRDRGRLTDAVRRVQSAGGGIYVYSGLKAGWEQLKQAEQGQRHLILFADAADAEEPGTYKELLATMVRQGITVSVIGLGSDKDVDAAFLIDVARRGNGRIFFNADPASLPALFSQETVAVARSAFLTDPAGVKPTAGWLEIADRPVEGLATVDGYNLSYLRPEATAAAFSTDEYAAPLIAFWNRGAGRVAAVSFPLGGEHSARVRAWPRYGDFLQTLGRWLMGKDTPPGIGLRARVEGSVLVLDLIYDEAWESRLAAKPPEVLLAEGASGKIETLVWERIEPGHAQARRALAPDRWYRGAVRAGDDVMPFGPVESPSSAEWRQDPRALRELATVSALSGGSERDDLSTAWKDTAGRAPRDLRAWLLGLFGLTFVAAVAQSRFGWRLVPSAAPLRRAVARVKALFARRVRTRDHGAVSERPARAGERTTIASSPRGGGEEARTGTAGGGGGADAPPTPASRTAVGGSAEPPATTSRAPEEAAATTRPGSKETSSPEASAPAPTGASSDRASRFRKAKGEEPGR